MRETGVPSGAVPAAVASPAAKAEEKKKRYLKEHFAYIRESIMQKVAYPPMARKMGWSGVVTVRFIVEEDGSVSNLRVEKGCSFQLLDRAAMESVKLAAPFPKAPVRAELVVPISYRLE